MGFSIKERSMSENGMRARHKRELTGSTKGGSLSDKGRLVRAARDRTRSEAAACGRSERRRVGSRGGAACCDTQIIMKAKRGIRKHFLWLASCDGAARWASAV